MMIKYKKYRHRIIVGIPTTHSVSVVTSNPIDYVGTLIDLGWVWMESHHTEDKMEEYIVHLGRVEEGWDVRLYLDTVNKCVVGWDSGEYDSYNWPVIEDTFTSTLFV